MLRLLLRMMRPWMCPLQQMSFAPSLLAFALRGSLKARPNPLANRGQPSFRPAKFGRQNCQAQWYEDYRRAWKNYHKETDREQGSSDNTNDDSTPKWRTMPSLIVARFHGRFCPTTLLAVANPLFKTDNTIDGAARCDDTQPSVQCDWCRSENAVHEWAVRKYQLDHGHRSDTGEEPRIRKNPCANRPAR